MALASAKAQPLTNGKLKLMICDDSNIIRRKIERELQIDRLQVVSRPQRTASRRSKRSARSRRTS
jgi:hypothetical protein